MGRPGIATSHMCDEKILWPSGRVTKIGVVARRLFRQGAPFVKNNEVAPVSIGNGERRADQHAECVVGCMDLHC